ncbi:hypothetical protein HanHA300_Chr11g0402431 [Helianthus annuus]|nr:hypothetical protein HanHA300_Chr11g0402431 [Helianthus annuus]KAJ0517496.1 hypothetical protein HanHA89_Chr11g0425931 [Helianthus annuus]KAJ0685506.1 hypothetical protein HanLR1_Chr11g0403371 [Helianthus annuus]KAJ0689405.1 hypothetical protein HanOQP8_Chr11g0405261 [Helianthus annuus]
MVFRDLTTSEKTIWNFKEIKLEPCVMCEHLDKEPHFNLDRNFLKLMKNTEILMLPHFYDM